MIRWERDLCCFLLGTLALHEGLRSTPVVAKQVPLALSNISPSPSYVISEGQALSKCHWL